MNDDTRPGGGSKDWVDPERQRPKNAFDKDDGYSGQQYDREAELAQGEADRAADTPRERSQPEHLPPQDPNAFEVPGKSASR